MTDSGLVEDTSKLWWDIRPNARFPTLEMRITDVCTRLDDTVAIAAFYVSLASRLQRLRRQNQKWRVYSGSLIKENRWRAQRYGLDEDWLILVAERLRIGTDLIDEIIELVGEDAERLGCLTELEHLRVIQSRGTSAHLQLDTYDDLKSRGLSHNDAMRGVVDALVEGTKADL